MVNAIILASVVIILADAAAENDVSFLSLKMETSGAYGVAAWALFLGTLMIAQLFARLADIVALADTPEAPDVLATLFNHHWFSNPFSYFGSHPVATLHASFGMGFLTLTWWLGLTALAQLWGRMSMPADSWDRGVWYAYVVAGFLALAAILNVGRAMGARLGELAKSSDDAYLKKIRQTLKRAVAIRCTVAFISTAFGYWFSDEVCRTLERMVCLSGA